MSHNKDLPEGLFDLIVPITFESRDGRRRLEILCQWVQVFLLDWVPVASHDEPIHIM